MHGPTGLQQQQNPDDAWLYPAQDALGSVRAVADANMAVLEGRHYEPYGEPWGMTGAEQTDFGFTGEPTDENGLVYLRARHYNPMLGVFPSLDPLEGEMSQAMSLNRYGWIEGNIPNRIDPSGMKCSLSIGTRTATCQYERKGAVDYAVLWGPMIGNDDSSVRGITVPPPRTDCTNFASQVLHFGGKMPMTDHWFHTIVEGRDAMQLGPRSESWAGANFLLDFLTGASDIQPSALAFRVQRSGYLHQRTPQDTVLHYRRSQNIAEAFEIYRAYREANGSEPSLRDMPSLRPGDLIFYGLEPQRTLNEGIDHVAVIVGWGCPSDSYHETTDRYLCSDPEISHEVQYVEDYRDGLVPWIADHGVAGYGLRQASRIRPFDVVGSYMGTTQPIVFVQIPDSFTVHNVRESLALCPGCSTIC